jgi:hypothetical protein
MHAEIGAVLKTALKTRNLVRVYAEAERIRQANLKDNIALEDIVSELMRLSVHGPGFEANPADARDALLGTGSPAEQSTARHPEDSLQRPSARGNDSGSEDRLK